MQRAVTYVDPSVYNRSVVDKGVICFVAVESSVLGKVCRILTEEG